VSAAGSAVGGVLRVLRTEGAGGLARRAVLRAYHRLDAGAAAPDIHPADIWSSGDARPTAPARPIDGPARIAWLCRAPAAGSGGHTTLFRMIAGMSARGHRNTIALYDPQRGDPLRHTGVIAAHWPWLGVPDRVAIADAAAGLAGFDAVVASSWATAHVAARHAPAGARVFYFIQDFEPYFYPRGALYALAEDTYRFGFVNIALGDMVGSELDAIGAPAHRVPFGVDTGVYRRAGDAPRHGISVYVRRNNDRRGYLLARAAVERFHERHPEHDIHVYGDAVGDWAVPVVSHGTLAPAELDALYNRVVGGLALSFTNISLIAAEMLAAGAIPVINDARSARADLSNPYAVWAAPTPAALADALCTLVESGDVARRSLAASRHRETVWSDTQAAVAELIEGELARPSGSSADPEKLRNAWASA